jgi:hypothetical protein
MLAHMADWRQIQARIRKAKASPEAPAQLAELYERTRDAMVAFELAQWHEKAGDNGEAVRWYTAAAERFRRAQWRTKAEEALTRLGAVIPVYTSETVPEPKSADARAARGAASANAVAAATPLEKGVEKGTEKAAEKAAESAEEAAVDTAGGTDGDAEESPAETAAQTTAEGDPAGKKRRRRGRRGGRKRRSGSGGAQVPSGSGTRTGAANGAAAAVPLGSRQAGGLGGATFPSVSSAAELSEPHRREFGGTPSRPAPPQTGAGQHSSVPSVAGASVAGAPAAEPPSPVAAPVAERDVSPPAERGYESAPAPSWQGRTRAGEPALASRISQLESQLRRLLACPLGSLDDADLAPAGPGVLLLSDSDQVTHYYIESCQTLRIGIGNLLRGGRGSKDGGLLKTRMSENLGIAELRVSRYLKEHCAVRWLQLDEGAPELAHFAIAVLRPVVNE